MLRPCITTMALISVFCTLGCGDENPATFEVTGTVVFKDGAPLTDGSVEFETEVDDKPITAIGQIGPDGTFKLGTYEAADGALPGKHRVAVFAHNEIGTKHERPDHLPPLVLDPRFSNFITSKLEFTVKEEGKNDFRIEVERIPED
ncbi:MAG: hypothetical protein AB8G99_00995 [Planctomycetaceae bacterium]